MSNSSIKQSIIAAVIISFFVGGATGGVVGAFMATSATGTLQPIFTQMGLIQPESETQSSTMQVVEESSTVSVVEKVSPAVVSIIISEEVTLSSRRFSISPFEDFFFDVPSLESEGDVVTRRQVVGGGSGFLVSSDGMVLTNKHVVDSDGAEYTVMLQDGREFTAEVLARDPLLDLAIIKIDGSDFPVVEFGDSDSLKTGQTVIAIGNTLSELPNTVTKGIVSGINRRVVAGGNNGLEVLDEAIQTDAAINPGNSGGPLVNLAGQVVGVNTAVNLAGQGVGFAIPINTVKQVVDSVREEGRIIRPWIGVRYVLLNKEIAKSNNLPVTNGALIVRGEGPDELAIIPGSPADKADLQENDIIISIDGTTITMEDTLGELIRRKKPGDMINLRVLQKGEEKNIIIELGELDSNS